MQIRFRELHIIQCKHNMRAPVSMLGFWRKDATDHGSIICSNLFISRPEAQEDIKALNVRPKWLPGTVESGIKY